MTVSLSYWHAIPFLLAHFDVSSGTRWAHVQGTEGSPRGAYFCPQPHETA